MVAHIAKAFTHPLVSNHRAAAPLPRIPMNPRIVIACAQSDRIEVFDIYLGEKNLSKATSAIFRAKSEGK